MFWLDKIGSKAFSLASDEKHAEALRGAIAALALRKRATCAQTPVTPMPQPRPS
jgi:hypothetical protein